MLAARLYGPRNLRVEEAPVPKPPPGWLLLRSIAVGICGTDKAFYTGSYRPPRLPLVPGHEAVGLVVSAPPGWERLVGRLVVPEINMVPLEEMWREPCRSGLYIHCPPPVKRTLGIDFDGALAEYFVAPPHLVHVAEGLEPVEAVYTEPLAAVLKAFRLRPVEPGDTVLIVGTGALAALAAQVAALQGASKVVVAARRGSRKRSWFEDKGFKVVDVEELPGAARELGRWGLGFDVVFEATGSPEALRLAVSAARPRGVVHLKSTHGRPAELPQTEAVVKELLLVASRCGEWRDFEEALRLLRERRVEPPPSRILWGVESAPKAFEEALRGDMFRVIVRTGKTPWELGVPEEWSP